MRQSNRRRASKTPAHAPNTRELIIDHAIDLFGRFGFDGVSMRQLAETAGTNLGAATYHFGGKQELYDATLDVIATDIEKLLGPRLERLEAELDVAGSNRENLRIAVCEFIDGWAREILGEPEVQRRTLIIARELASPSPGFEVVYNRFYSRLYRTLGKIIQQAVPAATDHVYLSARAHGLLNLMLSFIANERMLWRQLDWNGYNDDVIERLLPGLRDAFLDSAGLCREN